MECRFHCRSPTAAVVWFWKGLACLSPFLPESESRCCGMEVGQTRTQISCAQDSLSCLYKCFSVQMQAAFLPGMRVYLHLAAHLRGKVGGLCGNFDGDAENDFTTRQGIVESTAELFGNSWKVSPSCPDVANQDLRNPCAVSSGPSQTQKSQENNDIWSFKLYRWTFTEWCGPEKDVPSSRRNSFCGVTLRCPSSSIMTGVSLTLVGEWQPSHVSSHTGLCLGLVTSW